MTTEAVITNIFEWVVPHPGPDEPPLAVRFPFSGDLFQDAHAVRLRDPDAARRANEIELDGNWSVAACDVADPVAAFAVRDLVAFCDMAMGVRPGLGNSAGRIRICCSPELGPPESHAIEADADEIRLVGADAAGMLRAVFRLEEEMRARGGPFVRLGSRRWKTAMPIRIFRSPVASYSAESDGHFDGEHYHPRILESIARAGFNAVWVKAWLRRLIEPVNGISWPVREQARSRAELQTLCARAREFGLSVFLHMQEPQGARADSPFWAANPEVRGEFFEPSGQYSLCSSHPLTQEYLQKGFASLLRQVPDLGGVTFITASEHQSHCFSRVLNPDVTITFEHWPVYEIHCPRCRTRSGPEVAGEILRLVRDGMREASSTAQLIAWNWSWSQWEDDPQPHVLASLPEDVLVMADVERGDPYEIGDESYINDEYSLTLAGPSERFRKTAAWLREHDRPILGKLQFSTSHEAGTLPCLPVLGTVEKKMRNLRAEGCAGGMCCWNFGAFPSAVTDLAREFYFDALQQEDGEDDPLLRVARLRYGAEAAGKIREAWLHFSRGGDFFPRDSWALGYQPLSRGPAYPLILEKREDQSPLTWRDTPIRNHRLSDWIHAPWTVEKRIAALERLLEAWEQGLRCFSDAETDVRSACEETYRRDRAVAEAFAILARCDILVTRFASLRDAYYEPDADRNALCVRMREVCESHLRMNRAIRPLLRVEPRIGFHGEAHDMLIDEEALDTAEEKVRQTLAALS